MDKIRRFLFLVAEVLVAVGANCAGAVLAGKISISLYLASLFTIAVTALSGLWAGIATAILTNLTMYFF